MKRDYRLLVIGRIYNKHLIRFIQNLKIENPQVHINTFWLIREKELPEEIKECIETDYYLNDKHTHNNWLLNNLYDFIDNLKLILYFKQMKCHYDIINIHYPSFRYSLVLNQLRRLSNNIVLTPWGSDIYRCNWKDLQILKILYKKADYITVVSEKFRNDVCSIMGVDNSKTKILDMASDIIDYIHENKHLISCRMAKRMLNVENKFVICCGYNGQRAQRHDSIINSIYKAKESISEDLVLFLPFMYGGDNSYKKEIVKLTESYGFNYVLFDTYLDNKNMFLLEQATDLLIHVQTTDASSCTIQEFIYLEKKVINGAWLKYPQLASGTTIPFFETQSLESLEDTIKNAVSNDIKIRPETLCYIESCGWKFWIKRWNNFFQSIVN